MNTPAYVDTTASSPKSARPWSAWMRQSHRWVSIAFTVTVLVNFAMLGQPEKVRLTVAYLPLIPLAALFLSGAYLFALPYLAKWRRSKA